MQPSVSTEARYTRPQRVFLQRQFAVQAVVLLGLSAVGVEEISAYVLALYGGIVVITEATLTDAAPFQWHHRVSLLVRAGGVVVAVVLALEGLRIVQQSGVLG